MRPSVTVVIMTEPTVKEKGVWGREETVSSVSSKKKPQKQNKTKTAGNFQIIRSLGSPSSHGGCIGD